jgi:thiol-disulfide isomerase/thioredoxin
VIRHAVVLGVRFFVFPWIKIFLRSNSGIARLFCSSRWTVVTAVSIVTLSLSAVSIAARQTVLDLRNSINEVFVDGRGKVLVFVFVRTDCPISNRYAPFIQQMSKKYGQEASFRLVFPDQNESPEKIRHYLKEYGYELSAVRDLDHALVKKTSAKVTPEAAVFNRKGQLVYHGRIDNLYEHIGQARRTATTHELADAIEAALNGVNPHNPAVDGVGCFISDLE